LEAKKGIIRNDKNLDFTLEYIGETTIPKNESLGIEILMCPNKENGEIKIEDAEHIFSEDTFHLTNQIKAGYLKRIEKENIINPEKYNFDKLYIVITYTINGQKFEDILEVPTIRL